jgi:hypothetical protein
MHNNNFGRCLRPALYAAIPHPDEGSVLRDLRCDRYRGFWGEGIPRISFTRRSRSVGGRCDRYRGITKPCHPELVSGPHRTGNKAINSSRLSKWGPEINSG